MNSTPCAFATSFSEEMDLRSLKFGTVDIFSESPETIFNYGSLNFDSQDTLKLMGVINAPQNEFQPIEAPDLNACTSNLHLQNLLFLAHTQLFNQNYGDSFENCMVETEGTSQNYASLLVDIDAGVTKTDKLSYIEGVNYHSSKYNQKCTICRIEDATVFHFGVDVCTGCRAFFRRSVAQQKTYRCLNSRLCGNNTLVPNRRVCKFCRFQRCIDAGMLKSKEMLQLQKMDSNGNVVAANCDTSLAHLAIPLTSAESETDTKCSFSANPSNNVLEQFILLRKRITYERLQDHYKGPQISCPRDVRHHAALSLKEFGLLSKGLDQMYPFNSLSPEDKEVLWAEYSICWTVSEICWSTIRNGGHYTNTCYHVDGSYIQLDDEGARTHWGALIDLIPIERTEYRSLVFEALIPPLLAAGISLNSNLCPEIAKASLSEEEISAFVLLIFTRQEVLGMVSESTADALLDLRQKMLSNLADHLKSNNNDVAERMGQIIFLISNFQSHINLLKNSIKLIRVATSTNNVFPDEYTNLLDSAEKTLQERVIRKLQSCSFPD
ncbi:zinc finger, c4 type (two domains) domain-containing protein [Ditylenchus destructor]|uniref:Zinc finger, c4 type (Two domains) domain-containing protein n=1 Tax=Ditylenchus destructor TaxID=166010 RepID=A0AAD4R3I0_9BILA|nr:zinc finger, c4 type (two domains) domain-containing protein [Ditylenchus destructor]